MIDRHAPHPPMPNRIAPPEMRARLQPWVCEGKLRDGRHCGKTLMELDPTRPSYIRKICERCSHPNVWVEAYRPI